ncbi:MAG: DUF1595 domain-containing protein [Planctomycetota bacterium]
MRNVYDDKSPLAVAAKDEQGKTIYPEDPHLPTLSIERVEFHRNAYPQWPPESHRQILFDLSNANREESGYVAEVMKPFMTRDFRRPIAASEVAQMMEFHTAIRPEFPTFEEAIRETLALVLIQPDFLFMIEPAGEEKRLITEVELASRLSYFLWSTMPDEHLSQLATTGELRKKPAIIAIAIWTVGGWHWKTLMQLEGGGQKCKKSGDNSAADTIDAVSELPGGV